MCLRGRKRRGLLPDQTHSSLSESMTARPPESNQLGIMAHFALKESRVGMRPMILGAEPYFQHNTTKDSDLSTVNALPLSRSCSRFSRPQRDLFSQDPMPNQGLFVGGKERGVCFYPLLASLTPLLRLDAS